MNRLVGVVLVNYQDYAERFLTACRDSLRAQDYPAASFKIYLVDNASSEKSRAYLHGCYPEAKILERGDGNYCAANNLGFAEAIKDGCEYLVALNMDTEMKPDWLHKLVLALEDNTEAAIAQSKILLYPQTEAEKENPKINTLGNRLNFLGFGFTSAYREADREISAYPEISGYASGCCLMIRREVFESVGGWDDSYYMYHDDIELSLKVRLAGYKIVLAPQSVVFHKYEFKRSVRMLYYMERNRYLLAFGFYPLRLLIFLAPAFIIMSLGMLAFALAKGWAPTWFKVWGFFLKPATWINIRQARARIKWISKVPFSIVAKNLESRIDFSEINNPLLKYVGNPLLRLYWKGAKKLI
ncbi:MAG: glycosyltransferase family 2 protein [Candidatus Falkowbacteria bacterium]|nr:MAG: glycosyltransferase family 2 protein [Candidatus Falkowbacteria bacterium]